MKKIFTIISLALLALACQKEATPLEKGRDCLVTFNTVGEVTITESELTRGAASQNDLYAVQVYKGSERFAVGIFDDVSKMQLNLKTGSTYDIRMCMLKEAKALLGNYFSLTNNGVEWGLYEVGPFRGGSNYLQTNQFFYNSNNYYCYYVGDGTQLKTIYSNGFELSKIRIGQIKGTEYPTCDDWFYGEVNKYTPTGEKATLDFVLKRTGFRLKYELSGVTDGEVRVQIYNNTRTFIDNTTTTSSYESEEQFIAFYDTYSAWLYADNYTENMTVKVTWKRGIGVTQDLGTKTIQVKRNCLNNVRITLSSDDKGAGVVLQTEDEASMGKTDTTIPVE